MGKYEILYADFPWPRTPCGTAKTPYKTMTWDEIMAFDLGQFLARDAVVFLWTTGPTHLRECAAISHWCEKFKLYEAGIAYRWIKTLRESLPTMPPSYSLHGTKRRGFTLRIEGELLTDGDLAVARGRDEAIAAAWLHWRTYRASREWLKLVDGVSKYGIPIGASGPRPKLVKQLGEDVIALTTSKRGRVFPLLTESQVQWVFEPKPGSGAHSRKPAIVRDKIVELLGEDRPKIELFSRQRVDHWAGHGHEYPTCGACEELPTRTPDGHKYLRMGTAGLGGVHYVHSLKCACGVSTNEVVVLQQDCATCASKA